MRLEIEPHDDHALSVFGLARAIGADLRRRAGSGVPAWARAADRYLDHGWWVSTMKSMAARHDDLAPTG